VPASVPVRLRLAAALAAAGLLAACSVGADATTAPTWVPKPDFSGEGGPLTPGPSPGGPSGNGTGPNGAPTSPGSPGPSTSGPDPAVVATRLTAPTGLTVLPDGTALVGERTTGRIVQVEPLPGQPVRAIRTLTGIDASGDGGLLDLTLSPTYDEDGLIYAYLTTATDNRVVAFTINGPPTPILTGIPKGRTGNTGRLLFDEDGTLYVGTGDAGLPALAADPTSLAGKVLRVTAIGAPAAGNPSPASTVYTRGHQVVDGLCLSATGQVLEVEPGPNNAATEVNILRAGADYGYPTAGAAARSPDARLPDGRTGVGGCAIIGVQLYVTSRDATSLLVANVTTRAGTTAISDFQTVLSGLYGRLLTVVAAPDGALWLTTSNKDGHGHPIATDERVLRITPSSAAGQSQV
jgi:glucose/arabinose dehydrogenase